MTEKTDLIERCVRAGYERRMREAENARQPDVSPTERDREMGYAALAGFVHTLSRSEDDGYIDTRVILAIATARAEERERCAPLIAACQKWRASLEGDGWTEAAIHDMARPGLSEIIIALDRIVGK